MRWSLLTLIAFAASLLVVSAMTRTRDADAQQDDETPTPSMNYLPSVNVRPPPTATPALDPSLARTATAIWLTHVAPSPTTGTPPPPGVNCVNLVRNGGFEELPIGTGWVEAPGRAEAIIRSDRPFAGSWGAALGGYDDGFDLLITEYAIPHVPPVPGSAEALISARLSYRWRIEVEPSEPDVGDILYVQMSAIDGSGTDVFLDTITDEAESDTWHARSVDVRDQLVRIRVEPEKHFVIGSCNYGRQNTTFYLDEVALDVCYRTGIEDL